MASKFHNGREKITSYLENSQENDYSSESDDEEMKIEDESNSETDTEDELTPEILSEINSTCKRLKATTQKINKQSKNKSERRPTRLPDPKTCNRNALMARENRRKKKEYVEKLENSIKQCLNTQKKLQKVVKKQARLIEKLQFERNFYKNMVGNKNGSVLQAEDIENNENTPQTSPTYSISPSRPSECDYFTSKTSNIELSPNDFNKIYDADYTNDFDSSSPTSTFHDSWDNLLEYQNSSLFPVNDDDLGLNLNDKD